LSLLDWRFKLLVLRHVLHGDDGADFPPASSMIGCPLATTVRTEPSV